MSEKGLGWSTDKDAQSDIEHGTYRGYSKELRYKIPVCPECRAAAREYQREHAPSPEQVKLTNKARMRAFTRLSKMHPEDYKAIYRQVLDELAAEQYR